MDDIISCSDPHHLVQRVLQLGLLGVFGAENRKTDFYDSDVSDYQNKKSLLVGQRHFHGDSVHDRLGPPDVLLSFVVDFYVHSVDCFHLH